MALAIHAPVHQKILAVGEARGPADDVPEGPQGSDELAQCGGEQRADQVHGAGPVREQVLRGFRRGA